MKLKLTNTKVIFGLSCLIIFLAVNLVYGSITNCWLMNEGSGTTAHDSVGSSNGSIINAAWVGSPGGYALHFNGTNNYVNCGNGVSLSPTSAITLEAWFKLDSTDFSSRPWANIVNKEGPASGYYLQFYLGHLSGCINTTNGTAVIDVFTPGYNVQTYDLNWHSVSMTYDGSSLKLYYDGSLIGSVAASGQIVGTNYNLWIGGMEWVNGRFFQGSIADVQISNSAHSSTPLVIQSTTGGGYVQEFGRYIVMGNQLVEFTFDKSYGGKLCKIVDKRATGVNLNANGSTLSGEWTIDLDGGLAFSSSNSIYSSGTYSNGTLTLYSGMLNSELKQVYVLKDNSPYLKCQAEYKNLSGSQTYLKTYDYSIDNVAIGGSLSNNKYIYPPGALHLMEGNVSDATPGNMGSKYVYGNMQQTTKMMLPYAMIYNAPLQQCMTIAGVNSSTVVHEGVIGGTVGILKSLYHTYKHINNGSKENLGTAYVGIHRGSWDEAMEEEKNILITEAGYSAPSTLPSYFKDQVILGTGIPDLGMTTFNNLSSKLTLAKSRGIKSFWVGGAIWTCPWSIIPGVVDFLSIYQNGSYEVAAAAGGVTGLKSLISSAHYRGMKIFTWGPTFAGTAQIPLQGGGWTPPTDVVAHPNWWVYNETNGYNLWYPDYIPPDPGSAWGSEFLIPLMQKIAGTAIGADGVWLDSSWQDHQLNYQASDGWYGRPNGSKLGLVSQAVSAVKAINPDFMVMAEGAGAEMYSRVDTAYLQVYGIWPAIEASSIQKLIEMEELNRLPGTRPFGQICEGQGVYAEIADETSNELANKYKESWRAKTFLVNTLDRTPVYWGMSCLLSNPVPTAYQTWVTSVTKLSALRDTYTQLKDGITFFDCVTVSSPSVVQYVRHKTNQDSICLLNAETVDQNVTMIITNAGVQLLNIVYGVDYTIKNLMTDAYILNAQGGNVWRRESMTGGGISIALKSYEGAVLMIKITSVIVGKISFENYTDDVTVLPVTAELLMHGGPTIIQTINVDNQGNFAILNIPNGIYDVRIKASHWLAKMTLDIEVAAGNKDIGIITLINGDVVDNNEVDFSDINAVRAAYGSFPGDDTWDELADVDGSGEVDFTDINIVRSKYGEIGD